MTSSTTGVPVATTACSSSSWRPGSSSDDREAASPIMFCHSPATTTATSAPRARSTARWNSASSSNPSGSSGVFPPNMSNIDGNTRCTTRHAAGVIDPHAVAGPGADAVQHGDRLVEVEVEDPRPEGVALGVGQRPDDRDRAQAAGVERQQVALVAQQHRRPLRGDAGHLAVRGIGEHLAGAVLVDVRVVEQAHPHLRLQHAPHARVDVASARRARLHRLGQVARRRGRRSPSPCPRRR